ncbi:ABC transporter substrate-binding protein [Geobacter argillaceus]|uniref:Amino acid/amide ABC transporter substrate-binding protein (HAAT family) n=1 Tax=Geobacter argillaceus TaxID=345631 RepID=A0A562VKQ9_9BACT|nr:ABC transporter substrate-binding protein [Geobacter argillaceus]TWJ18402.1 amino acid/amide ABC transporter substrate-binding protein (HAAT family) [Geobacter argillaceus]
MKNRLTALALSLCVATPGLAQAAKVKLGFVNSITGPEAPIGENLTNGVTLALEDLKKRGIDVELVKEDDTGKPEKSMAAFEKMATRDKVAGVVGPYSSKCANAVAKLAEKYKTPLLIPVASKEEITRQNLKWTFRLSATTNDYANILLDMATSLGKPKTIAIINENTDFGTSGARSAKAFATKRGISVVAEEAYSPGSPDYRSTLSKIKSKKPDLVFMISYVADAILLMRQSREIGITPQAFLGAGAGFSVAQFAKEKEISNYVFSSTQWTGDVNWPGAKEFNSRYKAKFGKEPTYHASTAYASMIIMAETAAKEAGNQEKMRNELKTGHWNGIMGEVTFRDYDGYTNQNKHQMLVEQVQNGVHETVYPTKYTSKKPIYPFPGWKK